MVSWTVGSLRFGDFRAPLADGLRGFLGLLQVGFYPKTRSLPCWLGWLMAMVMKLGMAFIAVFKLGLALQGHVVDADF